MSLFFFKLIITAILHNTNLNYVYLEYLHSEQYFLYLQEKILYFCFSVFFSLNLKK